MLKIADDVARQGDPWALPPCDLPLATPAPGPQRARHQPVSTPQPAGKAKVPSRTRRSDITREIVLDISERLQAGGCSINGCAERHGVALRVVRALVQPGGRLTPVGRALVAGNIMTPLDRANAGLPPVDRQTGLNVEDHALAGKLIGVTRGKMSRAMFCDLFGYDYDLIYAAYNQNGSITGWGRRSRDAAPGSQAPQAPKWSTSGKVPGTGEQRRSMGAGNLAPRGAAGPVPTPRG
ncbi:hypothetical protein [Bordetella genomosp. 9]|nr:hypothetical protein [Bordetella genomosp. 9]